MKIKILSFVLVFILSCSLCITAFASEDSHDSIEIEIYNIETKDSNLETIEYSDEAAFVESYIPEDRQLPQGKQIIGGSDERYRVPTGVMSYFPYNIIGVVSVTFPNGDRTSGTGWLFGTNDVATAGHVLYNPDRGGYAESITFHPGQNNDSLSSTGYTGKDVHVSSKYVQSLAVKDDYAFFQVNGTPGAGGYFGWSTYGAVNDPLNIIGYPGEYSYQQWAGSGSVRQVDGFALRYDVDTTRGQSGAAVYTTIKQVVIGIHHGGYDYGSTWFNGGSQINNEISNIMYSFRNK